MTIQEQIIQCHLDLQSAFVKYQNLVDTYRDIADDMRVSCNAVARCEDHFYVGGVGYNDKLVATFIEALESRDFAEMVFEALKIKCLAL